MTVVVVTDTSCRLPADLREQWSIRQVPLHILLDGLDLRDGVDEIPDDIHKRHATTAGATPVELSAAYQRALADSGGDGVVAVHISSALSGTFRAAELTAAELGPAVRVIDSRSAAMGGKPDSRVRRCSAVGQSAPQRAHQWGQGMVGHRAGAQAAAVSRRRKTCSGPTGSHCEQRDGGDDRPGLPACRRPPRRSRGASRRRPGSCERRGGGAGGAAAGV
ncbi:DegV family EDD domain-containing protein [Mycobacterium tuberculosis]|nr:DegV family EDD domain-containing protein [Mycobacterium tuberculosis]